MDFQKYGINGRKAYFLVLILGMTSTVVTFNIGYELVAAGITVATLGALLTVKRNSERPVFDERDLSIAKESSHQALMWTGVLGGTAMIVISVGMGLNYWTYPEWIAPFYLSWGGIMALAVVIDVAKRAGISQVRNKC